MIEEYEEEVFLDDLGETDIYGNAVVQPDWSGSDDEFDGEGLIEFLLNGETE